MNETRIVIDEAAVIDGATAQANIVFGVIGGMIGQHARESMKQHQSQSVRNHHGQTTMAWIGTTPDGQPPKVRTGGIVNNIQSAQLETGEVIVGPIALPSHHTDCLARLEYGKHPFMQPSLESVVPKLPQVWAESVTS